MKQRSLSQRSAQAISALRSSSRGAKHLQTNRGAVPAVAEVQNLLDIAAAEPQAPEPPAPTVQGPPGTIVIPDGNTGFVVGPGGVPVVLGGQTNQEGPERPEGQTDHTTQPGQTDGQHDISEAVAVHKDSTHDQNAING